MRKLSVFICLCVGLPLYAASIITLTFEGLKSGEAVNDFYNGGTGSLGSTGPNYGISYTGSAWAEISTPYGGVGNFSGSPTMPTALWMNSPSDFMNVPAGFSTGFSFYYSAWGNRGLVNLYEGLNGTGAVVATLLLEVTPSGGAPECTFGQFCPWFPAGVSFAGIARSMNVQMADCCPLATASVYLDNVTLGSDVPTAGVPEPGLLAAVGGVLAAMVYRRLVTPLPHATNLL